MIPIKGHLKYIIFSYFVTFSNIVTGLILFPMILKSEGSAALGIFGLLFSSKSVIDMGLGWLSSSMTKELLHATSQSIFNKKATLSFIINTTYGSIVSIALCIYGLNYQTEYSLSYVYFSIYAFISFVIIPFYEILNSRLQQHQTQFFRFIQQFLFMLLSIGSYSFLRHLDYIFLSLFLSSLLTTILVYRYIFYHIDFKFSFTEHYKKIIYKVFISQGKKYFLNGISTIMLLQIDILIIGYLYGKSSAGIYLIIWKIPNTLIMLGWKLSEPLQIYFGNNYPSNIPTLNIMYFKYERLIFLAGIIASFGYFSSGKFIMDIWLGDNSYPQITYMFTIMSLMTFLGIIQRFYVNINYYTKGIEIVTKLQIIDITFKILATLILYPYFKEASPIVGWVISYIITLPMYRINSMRILKTK